MSESRKLRDDLGYVRDALDGAARSASPPSIYLVWAVIIGAGFPLYDFAPHLTRVYWPIVATAGALLSAFLGWRHARKLGQESARDGIRHGLHWLGLLAAIFLSVVLHVRGELTQTGLAAIASLLAGFAWYLAGVHLVPSMLWLGVIQVAGFLGAVFIDGFSWTFAGALIAVSLLLNALIEWRRDPQVA
jgi:hypothetical protein